METKQLSISKTDFKFGGDGSLQFSGYASVFNGVDSYGDTIVPGAYSKTLEDRERPVLLRFNHYGPVIGKFSSVSENEHGLYVEGELTKGHSVAEDVAASLRHGAISGLSIGYYPKASEPNERGGRDLKEIELIEISVVEEPADNSARIDSVKSALSGDPLLKDVEAVLRREFGLSQQESTVIVSAVKNAIRHGDRVSEKDVLDIINSSFC